MNAWLGDAEAIPVIDEASLTLVRERVRALGSDMGLPRTLIETLATAATELSRNQLLHASHGRFAAREVVRGAVRGVELVAADRGAGLARPGRALEGSVADGAGLGKGLAAVREVMDELDFDVRLGEGSCVWARRFEAPTPHRSEVAILGRACVGETESGDDADFVRADDVLTVGVIDALGHGILARDVAAQARVGFRERAGDELSEILEGVDEALRSTRGAVMAGARIDYAERQLLHIGLGDVRTHIYRPRQCRALPVGAGVLGEARPRPPRWRVQNEPLEPHDVVVMFSDGLTTRVDISEELALLRRHPIVIAEHLLERFGRDNDDVMILVAR